MLAAALTIRGERAEAGARCWIASCRSSAAPTR
jgi:hypothetical protein